MSPQPPTIHVDLDAPPEARWNGLAQHRDQARELAAFYMRDLDPHRVYRAQLAHYLAATVSEEVVAEFHAVAAILGVDVEDVALGNLCYDAIKHVVGCTAFAVNGPDGPILARNLDWWTEAGALSRYTTVVEYHRQGALRFRTIGWPGFLGAFTGVAPGRFAVSLNAVLSDEPGGLAQPVSLLLRDTLDRAVSFDEAVDVLCRTTLACDCLLLVVGVAEKERVVIERTPTRAARRTADTGPLVVTNEYLTAEMVHGAGSLGALGATSCARYERAARLIESDAPRTPEACLNILDDASVRMAMTVQQVALEPRTGKCTVRLPG